MWHPVQDVEYRYNRQLSVSYSIDKLSMVLFEALEQVERWPTLIWTLTALSKDFSKVRCILQSDSIIA